MNVIDSSGDSTARWGDSGSDPLADIKRFREDFARIPFIRPGTSLIIRQRVWRRIQRSIYRQTHGKRAWRRQRGKLKEKGLW